MSDTLRGALEDRRRDVAQKAGHEMLEGADGLPDSLDELNRISRLLDALPPPRKTRTLPLVIGVASVLVVALAWVTPIGALGLRTAFHLEAVAGLVSVTPSEDLDWRPDLALEPGDARLTAPRLSGWAGVPDEARLATLSDGTLALSRVRVPEGGGLALGRTDTRLTDIAVQGSSAAVELLVSGEGDLDGIAFAHLVPEVLRLEAGDTGMPAVVLTVSPDRPLHLRGLAVSGLRFGEPDGAGGFVSSLETATLRLPHVGRSLDLGAGHAFLARDLDGRVIDLVADPDTDGVRVVMTGTARWVSLEQAGVVHRATPSLLDYTLENQRIAFLLGALSAIWGLIWSARRLFFS